MYLKIAEILKKRHMSFSELSRLTGIGENVFSNLKKRNGNLSVKNLKKVAKALEVSIEELLLGNDT